MVQGTSADITKLAAINIMRAFEPEPRCKLLSLVHDEALSQVPGKVFLDLDECKFKDGFFIPKYKPDEEAQYWADVIQKCMEDAETEIFEPIYPLKGKAEAAVAPFWNH